MGTENCDLCLIVAELRRDKQRLQCEVSAKNRSYGTLFNKYHSELLEINATMRSLSSQIKALTAIGDD